MANNGMGMAVMALVVLAAGGLAWAVLARWHRRRSQRHPERPRGGN
jgi:hypothetical protein